MMRDTICVECYLLIPPSPEGSYNWEGAASKAESSGGHVQSPALEGPATPLYPGTPPDCGGSIVSSGEELEQKSGPPEAGPLAAEVKSVHEWTDDDEPEPATSGSAREVDLSGYEQALALAGRSVPSQVMKPIWETGLMAQIFGSKPMGILGC